MRKTDRKKILAFASLVFLGVLNAVLNIVFRVQEKKDFEVVRKDLQESKEEILAAHEEGMKKIESMFDEVGHRLEEIESGLGIVGGRLARTERTYSAILSEEKKRRVVEASSDERIAGALAEAASLFSKGKYGSASEIYGKLRGETRSDEVEFMYWRSLYLSNPMDSSLYPEMKKAIEELRSRGYKGSGMDEMLERIEAESAVGEEYEVETGAIE